MIPFKQSLFAVAIMSVAVAALTQPGRTESCNRDRFVNAD